MKSVNLLGKFSYIYRCIAYVFHVYMKVFWLINLTFIIPYSDTEILESFFKIKESFLLLTSYRV